MVDNDGAEKGKAAAKVQEAAANIHKAAASRMGASGSETETIARRYFDAIAARDVDGAVALWAPGGREHVRGQVDVNAPEGVREFIGSLIEAMPDMKMEVLETTTEGERCAVQWQIVGHFRGARVDERRASHRPPSETRRRGPAYGSRRAGAGKRRVPRRARLRPSDRSDAAAGLDRRATADGRVQCEDPHREPPRP